MLILGCLVSTGILPKQEVTRKQNLLCLEESGQATGKSGIRGIAKLLDFIWLLTGRGRQGPAFLIMDNLLPQSKFSFFKKYPLHAIRKYLSMLRSPRAEEQVSFVSFLYIIFKVNGFCSYVTC